MNYIDNAMRTNSPLTGTFGISPDLIHATLGMTDELFELHMAENWQEQATESGDLCWFIALAGKTLDYDPFTAAKRIDGLDDIQLGSLRPLPQMIHAFVSKVKKAYAYGATLDKEGLKTILLEMVIGLTVVTRECRAQLSDYPDFDGVLEANINKLKARYPEKFSAKQAIHRNEKAEMEAALPDAE